MLLGHLGCDAIVALLSHTKQMGFLSYGHIMRNGSLFIEMVYLCLWPWGHFHTSLITASSKGWCHTL